MSTAARLVTVAVSLTTALALGAPVATADETRSGSGSQDVVVTASDGVELDATIYRPEPSGPAPAVVLAHGFGGDKGDLADDARRLSDEGYVALAYSARGFGASGGAIALDAAVEGGDVAALVDWLAQQPDIALDGPGDPVVGVTGASYGGGISLLAAARDERIDAIVPVVAWHSLVTALAPDAVTTADGEGGVFKSRWAGLLFAAGGTDGAVASGDPICGRFAAPVCEAYATIARTGTVDDDARDRLARADVPDGAIGVPTLLIQARSDTLFGLEQSVANAKATTGPTRLLWIDGGHGAPGDEANRERVADATVDWFDRWLRDDPAAGGQSGSLTWRDGPSGRQRTVDDFPPATAAQQVVLQPGGGAPVVVSPPGGVPAALSTLPGLGGIGGLLPATDLPGQHVTFDSAALDRDLDVLGAPTTRLRLDGRTGRVRLFAKVYEVAADGSTTLVQSQVAPLQVDDVPADVTVRLPTLAHRFVAGSRVRLVLAATDQAFANRRQADVYDISAVDGGAVALAVPVLAPGVAPLPRTSLVVPIAVLAVALAAAAGVAIGRSGRLRAIARRMRRGTAHEVPVAGREDPGGEAPRTAPAPQPAPSSSTHAGSSATDPASVPPPVQIRGLAKTYADGHVAVDDVSFDVGQGQVFGLLGPNGAGKTTLLRMLLGLIAPTAGEARIFGERMRPGHPVLVRVGALVEGPGFAPYLTGEQNLRMYWEAGRGSRTRRPREAPAPVDEDAVYARALEVAALGAALGRPVKTYSHGMKQRLAIAQALLGDPDLLVLDEPTDGLDPGQIRGMRDVLAGLATEGRTVLVSSHLLAEVEQVCTHVAVMRRGHLVTTGPVSDLVAASGPIVVRTPHRARAQEVATALLGPQAVRSQSEGLVVDTNSKGPGDIVAALVNAGVTVEGVAPRQRLEDAFLRLLEDDA